MRHVRRMIELRLGNDALRRHRPPRAGVESTRACRAPCAARGAPRPRSPRASRTVAAAWRLARRGCSSRARRAALAAAGSGVRRGRAGPARTQRRQRGIGRTARRERRRLCGNSSASASTRSIGGFVEADALVPRTRSPRARRHAPNPRRVGMRTNPERGTPHRSPCGSRPRAWPPRRPRPALRPLRSDCPRRAGDGRHPARTPGHRRSTRRAAAPRRASSSGTEASWPSSSNRAETSSNSCRARGKIAERGERAPEVVARLHRRELLPDRAVEILGLLEVGDRRGEVASADANATPIGEHACEIERVLLASKPGNGASEQLQRLIDPSRVAAQRGTLQLGDVTQRLRSEPIHFVEVNERGGPTAGDRQHAGECQVGVCREARRRPPSALR